MAAPEVDKFGELMITKLRDRTLDFFDGLASSRWKSPSTLQLQAELAALSPEQRAVARRCVVASIDSGVHDFLFALVECHDFNSGISVIVDGKDVVDLSDGLHGEPWSDEGWIAKYSKHPAGRG